MKIVLALLPVTYLLFASMAYAAGACRYDEQAMLSLSEAAFDQGNGSAHGKVTGWRSVAADPKCRLAAAKLIQKYRDAHPNTGYLLAFHEGQEYAEAGDYRKAIPLIEHARTPKEVNLGPAWAPYVDATLAFLRHDRQGLIAARARLLDTRSTSMGLPPAKAGYVEVPAAAGQPPIKIRWPPNIAVVDGLLVCFTKPYVDAYAHACRVAGLAQSDAGTLVVHDGHTSKQESHAARDSLEQGHSRA